MTLVGSLAGTGGTSTSPAPRLPRRVLPEPVRRDVPPAVVARVAWLAPAEVVRPAVGACPAVGARPAVGASPPEGACPGSGGRSDCGAATMATFSGAIPQTLQ